MLADERDAGVFASPDARGAWIMATRPEDNGSSTLTYGFEISPSAILGVGAGASLQEIREAYRAKARKYHPDHGGDEWAFRIVARSYEILSTARVAGRVAQESRTVPVPERPAPFRQPTA